MGFGIAVVVMTAYGWSARRPIQDMVSTWALYVPGTLFYLHALAAHGARGAWQLRALTDKIGSLVAVVVGCSTVVDVLSLLVMLGALAWAQIDNPDFHWNRPWRRATVIMFLFYWLLPAAYGSATNLDKRLLPFIFLLSLAGARVGRRGRKLALIAVLLFFIRAGALERHFISLKPHLAVLADAISAIPPGARVLPLGDWPGIAPLPERYFWAYGVIARGWVSPCLLHDPDVQPLAMTFHNYDPCDAAFTSGGNVNWGRVENDFDYVWIYHVPQFSSALSPADKVVFEGENLQVLQLRGLSDGQRQGRQSQIR
jgi:hypothetical protein